MEHTEKRELTQPVWAIDKHPEFHPTLIVRVFSRDALRASPSMFDTTGQTTLSGLYTTGLLKRPVCILRCPQITLKSLR